ncbi:MAG TPA: hypothetical protein VH186_36515 [Chloroflexia bacterium]|nr:hypothetical protein [Chloroflexia bacterium]
MSTHTTSRFKSWSRSPYTLLVLLVLLASLLLTACGDATSTPASNTTAAVTTAATTAATTTTTAATTAAATTTTVAATTAATTTTEAASATTAASNSSAAGSDVPPYPGASILNLPSAVETQILSQMGSNINNPQVAAQVTSDDAAKVKAFYTDYLTKNGWTDATTIAGVNSNVNNTISQMEQMGGFLLTYVKGTNIFVGLGLPSSAAAGLGITDSSIPTSGTLVVGFFGQAKSGGSTSGATASAGSDSATATPSK